MRFHLLLFALFMAISLSLAQGIPAGPLAERISSDLEKMGLTQENANSRVLLITGSSLNGAERAILEEAKNQYPFLKYATTAPDSPESMELIESGTYSLVVLVGGPSQNDLAWDLNSKNAFNETGEVYDYFVAQRGKTDKGTALLVLSDRRGFGNARRENVKYSPLSLFLPPEYVPVAATGISTILLIILALVKPVAESKIVSMVKSGKKVDVVEGSGILGIRRKEAFAFLSATTVVGLSLTWQYLGPTPAFFVWLLINFSVCLFSGALHQLTNRLFAHLYRIKLEYRFWREGAVTVLVSSYLGNMFSTPGFLLDEAPKGLEKWKIGIVNLSGPMLLAIVAIFFAVFNIFRPTWFSQSMYTSCSVGAMASMLPLKGLNGKKIKEWSTAGWLLSFLFIAACYVLVTFIL